MTAVNVKITIFYEACRHVFWLVNTNILRILLSHSSEHTEDKAKLLQDAHRQI